VPPNSDPKAYMNTAVPVVSEKYDEVVFTNPKAEFHKLLLEGSRNKTLPYSLSNQPPVMEYFRTYGDEEEVQKMLAAKKFLEGQLREVKDRLLKADTELDEVKTSLALIKGGGAAGGNAGEQKGADGGGTAAGGAKKSKPVAKKAKVAS
jgi:hypothetical protein